MLNDSWKYYCPTHQLYKKILDNYRKDCFSLSETAQDITFPYLVITRMRTFPAQYLETVSRPESVDLVNICSSSSLEWYRTITTSTLSCRCKYQVEDYIDIFSLSYGPDWRMKCVCWSFSDQQNALRETHSHCILLCHRCGGDLDDRLPLTETLICRKISIYNQSIS